MSREPDRKNHDAKQRLAEALRANLSRRKDQAREKKAEESEANHIEADGDGGHRP